MNDNIRLDKLIAATHSRYACVILAARRARQLNLLNQNQEENLEHVVPPLVDTQSKNVLTIALEEISAGRARPHYPEGVSGNE